MATIVFKLGRWALIGALGIASATACGGRGNLPSNGGSDDGGDDSSGFGGTAGSFGGSSTAGVSSGGKAMAGASFAGSVSVGGSIGVGGGIGSAGTSGGKGCGFGPACPPPYQCVNVMCALQQTCKPNEQLCDPGSQLLVRCLPDGSGYQAIQDCRNSGAVCSNGACRDLVCAPGSEFCDGNDLRLCNKDGLGSFVVQSCANGLYCDSSSLSCQALCNPNTVDCNGDRSDGCETNVVFDFDNCGGCGIACSGNHVPMRLCNGSCSGGCQTGYDDCNGDKQSDGCETLIDSNANDCGGCGIQCSSNHVTAHCTGGECDGACSASFFDCNGDKQADGCESDTRSDVDNCGTCGVRCSSNHITRACNNGACGGTCKVGFADCNGDKQTDGCETNTRSDAENCGACNAVCAEGGCSNGVCSNLFTFSGVKQNVAESSLVGWTECYSDFYAEDASLTEVLSSCAGSQLMLACRKVGSDTLQLAAHAPFADVTFDTGAGDMPHNANGVGWYYHEDTSWGFAPEGAAIRRFTCDIVDSSLQLDGTDGDKRLCWHTSTGLLSSGWRCGDNDQLNPSFSYERVIYSAP